MRNKKILNIKKLEKEDKMPFKIAENLVSPKPTVVALAGAMGAGKTSLLRACLEAVVREAVNPNEIAIVLNEEGGVSECVPQHSIAREILANGCATCGDEREVLNAIETLRQQKREQGYELKLVFYEGFGSVPATEMVRTFQSAKYPLHVIGVLNGENHRGMLADYSHLLATHVTEATLAIVVTKLRRDWVPTPIADFIMRHRDGQGSINVIPSRVGVPVIPASLVRDLLVRPFTPAWGGHVCGLGCLHDHHHDHGNGQAAATEHRDVHGLFPYAFQLKAGVLAAQVQAYFGKLVRQGLVRVKGATETESFNGTFFGALAIKPISDSDNPRTLIVYFRKGAVISPQELYDTIVEYPIGNKEVGEEWHGYEMQRHSDLPIPELIARNQQLRVEVAKLSPYVTGDGVLVTHPMSLQNLKEGARRQGVRSSCMVSAITTCLEYWLQAVPLLQESRVVESSRAKALRELGVSLAWWATETYDQSLSPELLRQVHEAKPAVLIAQGLLALDSLRQNLWQWYWELKEFKRALAFPGNFTPAQEALIMQANELLGRLEVAKITVA